MCFDIIVVITLKDSEIIHNFGREYLKTKDSKK